MIILTIFIIACIALLVATLKHANNMGRHTRRRLKAALWLLIVGDLWQGGVALNGLMSESSIVASAIVTSAIAIWLLNERRHEHS